MNARSGLLAAVLTALLLAAVPWSAALARVTNLGGVFILHSPTDDAWEPGGDACTEVKLASWKDARTRIPADGQPHLVVLYAAFPEDSTGEVAGTCFGIRYSEQVKLWSSGSCGNGGFELPTDGWPASGGGNSVVNTPFKLARHGTPIPLYWFAVSCKVPGFFEVTPNPVYDLGGKFGNTETSAFLAPIAGYGRVGFDAEGVLPQPGAAPAEGACCIDTCHLTSANECDYYEGIFLGAGTTCENTPCGDAAMRGACCVGGECRMLTLLECAREHGTPLGEGRSCEGQTCPGAPADSLKKAEEK